MQIQRKRKEVLEVHVDGKQQQKQLLIIIIIAIIVGIYIHLYYI